MIKILIVGGGAAGMMAAVHAAAQGKNEVHLFEKNEKPGKKIYITGKGRCNLTNNSDIETIMSSVQRNNKFLYSAFYGFDHYAVMDFFEQHGCRLKTERGNRVFPVSDHASDVTAALMRAMKQTGVNVHLNCTVTDIVTEPILDVDSKNIASGKQKWTQKVSGIRLKTGEIITGDRIILATGGVSYPSCGSTGDGHRMASTTGHRMARLFPSLVPVEIKESYVKELQGLSLRNITASVFYNSRRIYEEQGEMLFTHFGVSGPLILSASSRIAENLAKEQLKKNPDKTVARYTDNIAIRDVISVPEGYTIELDLKPALSPEQLDQRLLREFEQSKNKQFKTICNSLFPSRLIPVMIKLSGIAPDKKINEITREERLHFAEKMKHLPMTVCGLRSFKEAIITKGGISVRDVSSSTMESRICQGLYFAGEILDVDALTGGFNLQIAWSTGYLAGINAAKMHQKG